jgi:hypothetical protein
MCVSTRERNQFPSVLLHPPPLAYEFSASYGEMSRRSGEAAEEDIHSDISPFRINHLRGKDRPTGDHRLVPESGRTSTAVVAATGSNRRLPDFTPLGRASS